MDQETIKAIADQIAAQTFLPQWRVWGLQFALWIVGTFIAAYAASYLAKRGEHRAIQADFETLKSQLQANTATVKTIETEIGFADWKQREWQTVRREKLEELMNAVQALLAWLSKEGTLQTAAPISNDTLPIEKVKMLGNLYFPELREEFLKITRIAYGMRQSIAEYRRGAISALDSEAHTVLLQKQSKSTLAFYESFLSAEQEFSKAAEKLMRSTLDPTSNQ